MKNNQSGKIIKLYPKIKIKQGFEKEIQELKKSIEYFLRDKEKD